MANNRREQLKNKRKQAEAENAAKEKKDRLTKIIVAVVLMVVLAVSALLLAIGVLSSSIVLSSSSTNDSASSTEIAELLEGIPQNETTIGNPNAPVTLVEYADLRCPFCADLSNNALKDVIDGLVRDGKLKIEFRHWPIIPGSADIARGMYAAANQGKAWNFIEEFYADQGSESETLPPEQAKERAKEIAERAGVPDMTKWEKDYSDPAFDEKMLAASDEAQFELNFTGTPAFAILKNGKLIATDLSADSSVADFEKVVNENS
jgi:protein-disulfide isomerase